MNVKVLLLPKAPVGASVEDIEIEVVVGRGVIDDGAEIARLVARHTYGWIRFVRGEQLHAARYPSPR